MSHAASPVVWWGEVDDMVWRLIGGALVTATAIAAGCGGDSPTAPSSVRPVATLGASCPATMDTYVSEFPEVTRPARVYGRFSGTCPVARLVMYHDGEFALQIAPRGDTPRSGFTGHYSERGVGLSLFWDGSAESHGRITHYGLGVAFPALGIAPPDHGWAPVHTCPGSRPSARATRTYDRPTSPFGLPLSPTTRSTRFVLHADGTFRQLEGNRLSMSGTYEECLGVITFHYEWYAYGAMATVWEGRLNVQYGAEMALSNLVESASYQRVE